MSGSQRLMLGGALLIGLAAILFGLMALLARDSRDPVEVMRLAGQYCGTMGGVGVAVLVTGLIRRRRG